MSTDTENSHVVVVTDTDGRVWVLAPEPGEVGLAPDRAESIAHFLNGLGYDPRTAALGILKAQAVEWFVAGPELEDALGPEWVQVLAGELEG